jgi:hypothetical protein
MITNTSRWSHPPVNQVVPSPWQATAGIDQQLTSPLEQHPQLSLGMRRSDVRHDPLASRDILRDLHRCGPRPGPHPPHERHPTTL